MYELTKVIYGNEINSLQFPKLNAQELDIFHAILSIAKNREDFEATDPNYSPIKFTSFYYPEERTIKVPIKVFIDLCRINEENLSYSRIFKHIDNTLEKLLKFIMKIQTTNTQDEKKSCVFNFTCFEVGAIIADEVHIVFTEIFHKLLINYEKGFTKFELLEFIELKSKYSKILYKFLKQFKTQGKLIMKWGDFLEKMQVPEKYDFCDIGKRILKPSMKELTAENNLFDPFRFPFKNLKYEITKEKGRGIKGRWGKITENSLIIFTFTPEPKPLPKEKPQAQNEEIQSQISSIEKKEKLSKNLKELIGEEWKYKDELLTIQKIEIDDDENEKIKVYSSFIEHQGILSVSSVKRVSFTDEKQAEEEIKKRLIKKINP